MDASGGHLGRAAGTLVGVLLLLAAAGCSSAGSTPTARPATSQPSTSPSPISTTDPGDPTLLPVPKDIQFSQAPLAIQNEWRQYYATGAITVVPNSTVPFMRPPTPQVVDATNGAVDSTTAQRWGDALMRENAWENWAIKANQTTLLDSGVVSAPAVTAGLVLPSGASGFVITGRRWASTIKLVDVPAQTRSFLQIADNYALLVSFGQGWTVSAVFPDGHQQAISGQVVPAGGVAAVTGKLASIPNFGELWFGSDGFACDNSEPQPVVALCHE